MIYLKVKYIKNFAEFLKCEQPEKINKGVDLNRLKRERFLSEGYEKIENKEENLKEKRPKKFSVNFDSKYIFFFIIICFLTSN